MADPERPGHGVAPPWMGILQLDRAPSARFQGSPTDPPEDHRGSAAGQLRKNGFNLLSERWPGGSLQRTQDFTSQGR